MNVNNNQAKSEKIEPTSVEKFLNQIDALEIDKLSIDERVRLYKGIQRKFGIDSSLNVQTLGGSQMIGNTIQINICDRSSLSDLMTTLVDQLGKEGMLELLKILLDKI